MKFQLISKHYTRSAAENKARKLNAERSKMRSSGAQRFDYVVRSITGASFPRRTWKVVAR